MTRVIKILRAATIDGPLLLSLEEKAVGAPIAARYAADVLQGYDEAVLDPLKDVFVAYKGKTAAGFIIIDYSRARASILDLWVVRRLQSKRNGVRGLGIGTALIEKAVTAIRKRRFAEIEMRALPESAAFYQKALKGHKRIQPSNSVLNMAFKIGKQPKP